MIKHTGMTLIWLWTLLSFAQGCAVEAGNPGDDDDDDQGKIQINIAGEQSANFSLTASSFQMFVESVQLYGYSDDEELFAELTPATTDIELFATGEIPLVAEEDIESGTYETVVIVLREDLLFRYLPDGVTEKAVRFEDESHRSLYVEQEFVVDKDEREEILIRLDLESSLEDAGEQVLFKPKVRSHRRKVIKTYEGVIDRDDGLEVCAYLYEPIMKAPPPKPDFGENPDKQPPPPPPGVNGIKPPSFSSKDELLLDDELPCENAYEATDIEDGVFRFDYLKPGKYLFRAFFEDGSFANVTEDVELVPIDEEDLLFRAKPDDWLWDEDEEALLDQEADHADEGELHEGEETEKELNWDDEEHSEYD